MAAPANNLAKQLQAFGRVIRVTQKREIIITQIRVEDSHSSFSETKQSDKVVIELVTRAHEPAIRELLVLLLNQHQVRVREAHQAPESKDLLSPANHNSPAALSTPESPPTPAVINPHAQTIVKRSGRMTRGRDLYTDSRYDKSGAPLPRDEDGQYIRLEVRKFDDDDDDDDDDNASLSDLSDPPKSDTSGMMGLADVEATSDEELEPDESDVTEYDEGSESEEFTPGSAAATLTMKVLKLSDTDLDEASLEDTDALNLEAAREERVAEFEDMFDDDSVCDLKPLLQLDSHNVYADEDLKEPDTLRLAAKLLHLVESCDVAHRVHCFTIENNR